MTFCVVVGLLWKIVKEVRCFGACCRLCCVCTLLSSVSSTVIEVIYSGHWDIIVIYVRRWSTRFLLLLRPRVATDRWRHCNGHMTSWPHRQSHVTSVSRQLYYSSSGRCRRWMHQFLRQLPAWWRWPSGFGSKYVRLIFSVYFVILRKL